MVSINGVTVSFGGYNLFDNVSFLINPKDRIGLAGKNGAGKSTMLKILAGYQSPTKGEVSRPKDCKIGYLPQDMTHQHGRTVYEETESAFEEIKLLQAKLVVINHQLETRTDYESDEYMNLIHDLTDINDRLNMIGVDNTEEEIEKVLIGLGFQRKQFHMQTSEFSGGWRMRIELAKLLLQKPDVLMLDEPTNHLDIEAIQWLEDFMEIFSGAVILISHDKTFLDTVTKRTIEIVNQKIYDYKTNYSHYLVLRQERKQQQENAAKNQQKMIDQTEVLIDKFRAKASKSAMAQSLIKKLDRLDRVEVDDMDTASVRFRFPPPAHSGKIVITAEHAGKSYGDKLIFQDANFIITKGEKIGLVGRNGEGKSTMMKMIADKVKYDGSLQLGHNILMGYFEQDQEEKVDLDKTVFETIDELAVGDVRRQVRSLLGSFLFQGDDIDKKVKVLSGGERGRLALCKLLLEPYNLLLLDEPTNHLDIKSKEVLKQSLIDYEGTLVMVSHDRDFMTGMCDRLFEFRDGHVKEYLCDIKEFMEIRKVQRLNELDLDKSGVKAVPVVEKKVAVVSDFEAQEKKKQQAQIQLQIKKAEEQIDLLEAEIKELDAKLAVPASYEELTKNPSFFNAYNKLKKDLEVEMQKWEDLSSRLV
ncbi:MAG: ABC-F family ATP-binding cassette domain-containing protein [Burkholderiales bacterium]|nr:ABC-F family ATP-binding cassette domain-containing protein [Bacteroidia bacterium]